MYCAEYCKGEYLCPAQGVCLWCFPKLPAAEQHLTMYCGGDYLCPAQGISYGFS